MKTLKQISIGEGFFLDGKHYIRTDLGCVVDGEVIISGEYGLEQISDETEVKPDMRVFDMNIEL